MNVSDERLLVRMISLEDQVRWLEKCLFSMRRGNKPEGDIALQEACLFTLKNRLKEVENGDKRTKMG